MTSKPLTKRPTKTYPGFGLSMIDRGVKEFFSSRCTDGDLIELKKEFKSGNAAIRCIYCGKAEARRWDHYFPVSKGGDTVLGNLVPACASCDDSKQNRTLDEWGDSKSKKRPSAARISEIKKIISSHQKRHNYKPRKFEDKLSKEQAVIYEGFKKRLNSLRAYLVKNGVVKK